MKNLKTMFLAIVMTLVLSVSLAGCGKDKVVTAEPPTDNEPVASESGESDVSLEGTYQSDSAPAVLGEKITFSGGTVTTATGEGRYKVKGGKLEIQYDNGYTSFAFSQSGDSITLDDCEFTKVDESASEVAYEPYTPTADDPYPGLIVGTLPSSIGDIIPDFVVNGEEFKSYAYRNLEMYLDGTLQANDPSVSRRYDGQMVFGSDETTSPPETLVFITARSKVYGTFKWKREYGAVLSYSSNAVSFTNGKSKLTQGSESYIYYSWSLGRTLTRLELANSETIDANQASELWPEDYEKFEL
jgi:hypothetical protein